MGTERNFQLKSTAIFNAVQKLQFGCGISGLLKQAVMKISRLLYFAN